MSVGPYQHNGSVEDCKEYLAANSPQPIRPEASNDELRNRLSRLEIDPAYEGDPDKETGYFLSERDLDAVLQLAQAHIDAAYKRDRLELAEKVSSAAFVYEVMNAPTNGAARDWVKAQLSVTAESGDKS